MAETALITGITGQDGSYLAELLLEKGYAVHGLVRRSSTDNLQRIQHLVEHDRLTLHYGDLTDGGGLTRLVGDLKPDEVYNLAAQSHVEVSFDIPDYTTDVTAVGAVRLLEAIRTAGVKTRYYQASSSEMFGKVRETPQTELTPFHPRSPYGCAKVYAHWITVNFRESYNMRVQRHFVQSRIAPARGDVCDPENFPRRGRIKPGCRTNCTLETWMLSATGVTPRNMWKPCGGCYSRMRRMIT